MRAGQRSNAEAFPGDWSLSFAHTVALAGSGLAADFVAGSVRSVFGHVRASCSGSALHVKCDRHRLFFRLSRRSLAPDVLG
jgi:hypothetical protein